MTSKSQPEGAGSAGKEPSYRDPSLPVEKRVADLLGRMTDEEKVGQLPCLTGWEAYEKKGDSIGVSAKFRDILSGQGAGGLWCVLRADPWTGVTLETGLDPRQGAEAVNAVQRFAIENSRLGIPLLFAEECAHGHMALGATVFPAPIALGSTWDHALIEEIASAIAVEVRAQGCPVAYGPILDIARDPRWSRVEETFGEDPFLCSRIGAAMVRGLQGRGLQGGGPGAGDSVIATLKHFAAHGEPEGGHNAAPAHVGERELREVHLASFRSAVRAGAGSVMSSYNEIDGVPCSSSGELLTGILRREWGFKGFVVSDLEAVLVLAYPVGDQVGE